MSVQTRYDLQTKQAYDGMKADMHKGTDIAKTVETAEIEFGRVGSVGSTSEKIILGGEDVLGIVVRELELEGGIPQVGERVAVRSDGPVFAVVDGAGDANISLNYDKVTGRLTTGAVAGDVVAFARGNVVLTLTKLDNAAEVDNIVRVNVVGVA